MLAEGLKSDAQKEEDGKGEQVTEDSNEEDAVEEEEVEIDVNSTLSLLARCCREGDCLMVSLIFVLSEFTMTSQREWPH